MKQYYAWEDFTERARAAVHAAGRLASSTGAEDANPEHLMLGLLEDVDSVASRILVESGVSLLSLATEITGHIEKKSGLQGTASLSASCARAILSAYGEAMSLRCSYVGTEHLLLGLLHATGGTLAAAFARFGVRLSETRASTVSYYARHS